MLDVPPPTNNGSYPILREEVEAAIKSPKKGKSELVQAGGEAMIDIFLSSAIRSGRQESGQHLGLSR